MFKEQFAALWDYASEIKATNVGSTVEFLCDHTADGSSIFKRLYIANAGCKAGFNAGCRKVINQLVGLIYYMITKIKKEFKKS